MFLSTLGLKTDGMITEFVKAKQQKDSIVHTVINDGRGSTPNPKKLNQAPIEAHILSFNPQVSHYKLENLPNRRYLGPHLTITDM